MAAVGDETSRFPLLGDRRDLGLRGGTVAFTCGHSLKITLRAVRLVADATISGTAQWSRTTDMVSAHLTVRLRGMAPVRLAARWRPFGSQNQPAVISGSEGKRRLAATAPAP